MKHKLAETVFTPDQPGENGRAPGKFAFPPESRPLSGYTIKRGIHRGGFGEVYYALSDAGKEVALKLLQQHMEIELRGVSQCLNLKHPNLVNIYDIRTDADGDHWIVMEFVSGQALDRILQDYPKGMPWSEVQRWMNGIAEGLTFLHDRGIVHRDLKPANVFLEHGVVKIGDVGLSKFISESHRSAHTQSVGTVYYMAPEVAHGRYGREVDVYSLGVVLYELLTGRVPFDGESAGEILMKHLSEKPNLEPIPAQFRPVLARALEKDPLRRTPTAAELRDEFAQALAGRTIPEHVASDSFPGSAEPIEPFDLAGAKRFAAQEARKAAKHARKAAREARRMAHEAYAQYKKHGPPPLPHKRAAMPTPRPRPHFDMSWWDRTPTWLRVVGIVVLVLVVTNNAGSVTRLGAHALLWVAMGCGIYYLVRWLQDDSSHSGHHRDAATPRGDAGAPVAPAPQTSPAEPVAMAPQPAYAAYSKKKLRQAAHRLSGLRLTPDTLRSIPPRERMTELTSSMSFAAICTALLTGVLFAFTSFFDVPAVGGQDAASAGLFGLTTLLASWSILGASKMWEGTGVDSTLRRLGFLVLGGLVGASAYWIDSSLMVAMSDEIGTEAIFDRVGSTRLVSGNSDNYAPTLPAYVVFFGGLFAVRKWWWQADSFRKRRFAVWSIVGTMLIAFLLTSVWEFPKAWALTWAAAISAVVHLSAAWIPPQDRPRLMQEARVHV